MSDDVKCTIELQCSSCKLLSLLLQNFIRQIIFEVKSTEVKSSKYISLEVFLVNGDSGFSTFVVETFLS